MNQTSLHIPVVVEAAWRCSTCHACITTRAAVAIASTLQLLCCTERRRLGCASHGTSLFHETLNSELPCMHAHSSLHSSLSVISCISRMQASSRRQHRAITCECISGFLLRLGRPFSGLSTFFWGPLQCQQDRESLSLCCVLFLSRDTAHCAHTSHNTFSQPWPAHIHTHTHTHPHVYPPSPLSNMSSFFGTAHTLTHSRARAHTCTWTYAHAHTTLSIASPRSTVPQSKDMSRRRRIRHASCCDITRASRSWRTMDATTILCCALHERAHSRAGTIFSRRGTTITHAHSRLRSFLSTGVFLVWRYVTI